jgi:hypothetical protein
MRKAKQAALKEGDRFSPYNRYIGVNIPDPVLRCKGLSAGAKLCYGRLVRYGGKTDTCHPRVKTLAEALNTSERNAQKYLAELSREGFIRRIPPSAQEANRRPNNIAFLYHRVFVEASPKDLKKG